MPLSFQSLSHGEIAFGFFNIESDMVLLNNYFLFAGDLCKRISELALQAPNEQPQMHWELYILDRKDIGNLMGAINGVDLAGFIGDVYKLFSFPREPHLFRQNPEGYKTRGMIEAIIKKYAKLFRVAVIIDKSGDTVSIGEYKFSRDVFHKLLKYVWAGGYPLWKDGDRPDYVLEMKTSVLQSTHPLFKGITIS